MQFLTCNIDRAIVLTQYDLRGFALPASGRVGRCFSGKTLAPTTANFLTCAAGKGPGQTAAGPYVDYFADPSFDQCSAGCKILAEDCDDTQKEAVQLIIQEMIQQDKEMRAEIAAGKREVDSYLQLLERSYRLWGDIMRSLVEAFEVNLAVPA